MFGVRVGIAAVVLTAGVTSGDPSLYYLNLYWYDDAVDYSCEFGSPGTSLLIAQIAPNTCHYLNYLEANTNDYVSLTTKNGKLDEFRQLCVAPPLNQQNMSCSASTCEDGEENLEENSCVRAFGASAIATSVYCAGSTSLSGNLGGFTITRFDEQRECSLENSRNLSGVAFMRNYDYQDLDLGCRPVSSRGNTSRWFSLARKRANGTTVYHGVVGCDTNTCTGGTCILISDLAESQCLVHNGGALKIEQTANALSQCVEPPAPPTPRHVPDSNQYGNGDSDTELLGGIVGGGCALALVVFLVAFLYRRNEFRHRSGLATTYHTVKNNYGTVGHDEEGMTTDI